MVTYLWNSSDLMPLWTKVSAEIWAIFVGRNGCPTVPVPVKLRHGRPWASRLLNTPWTPAYTTNGDRVTKSTVSFNSMTGDAFQQALHRNNFSADLPNTSYIFLSFDMTSSHARISLPLVLPFLLHNLWAPHRLVVTKSSKLMALAKLP